MLSNRALNEVRVGYAFFGLDERRTSRSGRSHWQKANGITTGSPRITFTGFSIAGNQNHPRHQDQDVWSVRDDFTYSFDARAVTTCGPAASSCAVIRFRRTAGSAWARSMPTSAVPARPPGSLVPTPLPALFPDAFNADTWNLAAISPLVRTYTIGVGDFDVHMVLAEGRRLGAGRLADLGTA